jgi:hypothetical protein
VLAPSRLSDPVQKLMFVEGRWLSAAGGHAAVEHSDGRVYLAISMRNVGSGMGVCQAWTVRTGLGSSRNMPTHAGLDEYRPHTRDLYIPAGDIGMWQGALRDPDDPVRAATVEAIDTRQPFTVELFYTDQIGRQRTIVRFALIPAADSWLAIVNRYWYLDWDGPRPESEVLRGAETIQHEQEAVERRLAEAGEMPAADRDVSRGGDEMRMAADAGAIAKGPDAGGVAKGSDAGGVGDRDGAASQAEQADAREPRRAGPRGGRSQA